MGQGLERPGQGVSVIDPKNPLEQLESSFNPEEDIFRTLRLPVGVINILDQARRTFDEIDTVADSIALHDLISLPLVACFDKENISRHLDEMGSLWGKSYQVENLVSIGANGQKYYFVLIAGERRTRALRFLLNLGQEGCLERYGKHPGSENGKKRGWEKLLADNGVDARVCHNISFKQFTDLQLSENSHKNVPPEEEAPFFFASFMARRKEEPKLALAQFARDVGRSETTIRNALRFCELPANVRGLITQGALPYGMAIQLARLQEVGKSESELNWWATRAVLKKYSVKDFTATVSDHLNLLSSGQTMMDIFQQVQAEAARRSYFRSVVAKETVPGLWAFIDYMRRVQKMYESGQLGLEDSPYCEGSPIHIFLAMLGEARALEPHFRELSRKKRAEAQQVIEDSWGILTAMGARTVDLESEMVLFQSGNP